MPPRLSRKKNAAAASANTSPAIASGTAGLLRGWAALAAYPPKLTVGRGGSGSSMGGIGGMKGGKSSSRGIGSKLGSNPVEGGSQADESTGGSCPDSEPESGRSGNGTAASERGRG